MNILRVHTRLNIRDRWISNLVLPNGLSLQLGELFPRYDLPDNIKHSLSHCVGVTRAGNYMIDHSQVKFSKVRGEIGNSATNLKHIEIIYAEVEVFDHNIEKIPITIKMTGSSDIIFHEYLISTGVARLRNLLLNHREVYTTSMLMMLINNLVTSPYGITDQFSAQVFDANKSMLLPNINADEHTDIVNNWMHRVHIPTEDELMEVMTRIVYGEHTSSRDVLEYLSFVYDRLPVISAHSYPIKPTSITIHGTLNSIITTTKMYYAIKNLSSYACDHWQAQVSLSNGFICEVEELDSCAGFNFPFITNISRLEYSIAEFMTNYLVYGSDCEYAIEISDGRHIISHITLRRTMDEILSITIICSDGLILNNDYDLILMSICSPIITL